MSTFWGLPLTIWAPTLIWALALPPFAAPRCSGPSLSPLGPGEEGGGFFPQATAGVNCLLRPLSFIAFHLHLQSASPIQLNLKRVMYAGG